jgi:hypothetical protein
MRRVWRSGTEIADVVRMSRAGLSDADVAFTTGIPKETIRAWRRGRLPERARRVLAGARECERCGGEADDYERLPRADYAYLLGMYLGDGWLARNELGSRQRPGLRLSAVPVLGSEDMRRLFTDACDRIGVAWRPWGGFHISVARREAVALLDTFIGPKS